VPPALNTIAASSVTAPNSVLSGAIPSASGVTPPGGSSAGVPGTGGASPVTPPGNPATGSSGGTVVPQGGIVSGGKKCDDPQTVTEILNCIGGDAQTLADAAKLSKEEAERKMGEIEGRAREQAKIQLTSDIMAIYGCPKETAREMAENRLTIVDQYHDAVGTGSRERIENYAGLAVGLKTNEVTYNEFMGAVSEMCGIIAAVKSNKVKSCDNLGSKVSYSLTKPNYSTPPTSLGGFDTGGTFNKPINKSFLKNFLYGGLGPVGGGQLSSSSVTAVRGVLNYSYGRIANAYKNYRCNNKGEGFGEGFSASLNFDVGVGPISFGVNASVSIGIYNDTNKGYSLGGTISGGATTGRYPTVNSPGGFNNQSGVYGFSAGASVGGFVTNARNVGEMSGPFDQNNIAAGQFSGTLATAPDGTTVYGASVGKGLSEKLVGSFLDTKSGGYSTYPTDTRVLFDTRSGGC
jgi:hypothetical protein